MAENTTTSGLRAQTGIQKTTPGSYEAPVYGIVDYDAFGEGFDKGIAPGLEYIEKEGALKIAKKAERKKMSDAMEAYKAAGGDLLIDGVSQNFNASMDISNHYKSELERIRAKIEDINTPDEEVKQLQGQYENLGIINSTVQTLVDIDNDKKLYNLKASTLHERFVEQGTTIEEFRGAYNDGTALPVVRTINGVDVGGMEFVDSKGKKKFVDLQYKINENTIKSSVEIRTDNNLNTATTAFSGNHKSFEETDQYNTASSTVKRSVLAGQYVEGAIADADNAAIEFINDNPGFEAGLFQQASADDSMFSAEDQNFLEAYGSVYNASNNRASYKALHAAAVEKIITDRGLTKDEVKKKIESINTQATKTIEDKKNNIILQFVANENLKKLKGDFFVQNKDEVIDTSNLSTTEQEYYTNIFGEDAVATGSVTLKANKAYPKKALYESTQDPKEEPKDPPIGGRSDSDKVKGRLFNITSNINDSVYNFITPSVDPKNKTYLKVDGYKDINIKELTGGSFADIDGTEATLTSGRVVREGNNMFLEIKYDVGRSGDKINVQTEQFPIARIEKDGNGKEKAVADFAGRKRFAERIYKAQFGSSTADTATDLLTGDDTVYKDRTKVQEAFSEAGKDETMFRRLNVIQNHETDPEVWNTLTPEDNLLLLDFDSSGNYINNSKLAKAYRDFLDGEAGRDFDNN